MCFTPGSSRFGESGAILATGSRCERVLKTLFLTAGPALIRLESHPGENHAGPVDVTDSAIEFLFLPIELDPDLTLGDIFRLLDRCEALHRVFRQDFASELCAEARKGPLPPTRGIDPSEVKGIEYLELHREWRLDTSESCYWGTQQLHLHGIGHVLDHDVPEYFARAGDRIQWSVSLTPLRELLSLRLSVRETFDVLEEGIDASAYGSRIASAKCSEVTLGQVIHGVLWELSFHGAPKDQEQVLEELLEQKAEIDAGSANSVAGDDIFDELDNPGFAALFSSLGNAPRSEVRRAIRDIPDEAAAAEHLRELFGDEVVVSPLYRELSGRAFRKAFRTAG